MTLDRLTLIQSHEDSHVPCRSTTPEHAAKSKKFNEVTANYTVPVGARLCFSFQFLVVVACSCSQSFLYSHWPNTLPISSRLVVPTLRRYASVPTPASAVVDESASRSGVKTGDGKQTATSNACAKMLAYNG